MKILFSSLVLVLSFVFMGATLNAQMVTNVYTKMSAGSLPPDFVQTDVPSLLLPHKDYVYLMLPDTLDNDNDSLAVADIMDAVLDSIVNNYLVQSFRLDTTLSSIGQAIITDISRQFGSIAPGDKANQYGTALPVYYVSVTFRWKRDD